MSAAHRCVMATTRTIQRVAGGRLGCIMQWIDPATRSGNIFECPQFPPQGSVGESLVRAQNLLLIRADRAASGQTNKYLRHRGGVISFET